MKLSKLFAVLLATCLCTFGVDRAAADMIGIGVNAFNVDFVTVANPGNLADTTGDPNPAGAVPYSYRIGKYEISRDMINKANAANGTDLNMRDMSTLGGNGADKPATGVSWFDAARFANYLNTATGNPPAYKFDTLGLQQLWLPSDPGYNPNNLFRNTRAKYFLPSIDEWYKAAYYNPSTGTYFDYATGGNVPPTAVGSGTAAGTAVHNQPQTNGPANITVAGGLSPYGTMAQSGNVYEWNETEGDLVNDSTITRRTIRGGNWDDVFTTGMSAAIRSATFGPSSGEFIFSGFRVASIIPEPSTLLLGALAGAALLMRRRSRAV